MAILGRRGRRAGFSMVEVTVVTGILTTLASQSGSAYMQAKNKAAADQCIANLQQIYQAIQMHDEEGRLPTAWFFPWKGVQTADGGFQLDPTDTYNIVNIIAGRNESIRKLFICPAAPDTWQKLGITYVYNDTLSGQVLDNLPNLSERWLMMDANVIAMDKIPAPHLEGYNVLYCDGHVKWVPKGGIAQVFQAGLLRRQGQGQGQGTTRTYEEDY